MFKIEDKFISMSGNEGTVYRCTKYCDECGKYMGDELVKSKEYKRASYAVHYCDDCQKKFKEESDIDNDYDYLDEESEVAEVVEETLFRCPICGKTYNTKDDRDKCKQTCYEKNKKLAEDTANVNIHKHNLNVAINLSKQLNEIFNLLIKSEEILDGESGKKTICDNPILCIKSNNGNEFTLEFHNLVRLEEELVSNCTKLADYIDYYTGYTTNPFSNPLYAQLKVEKPSTLKSTKRVKVTKVTNGKD